LKDYDISGREKTTKTPKMVKNIENFSNLISKSSRSMFSRQFDMCLYIVNKVVNKDLKIIKIWSKFVQTSLTNVADQKNDIDYVFRM